MSKKILPRASVLGLALLAAFGLSACTWGDGDDGGRDHGGGFTRNDPPAHWEPSGGGRDHEHHGGRDHDRGGRDHDRGDHDHERGHGRHESSQLRDSSTLKSLASLDEKSAGKMFDGSRN